MLIIMARTAGFTMIELMIAIAILALAVAMGVPSYRVWIQNTQIRTAAESIQGGLQRARAEAVGRNSNVSFILGTDSDSTASWQVSGVSEILDESKGREGSKNVVATGVQADGTSPATMVTFSSLATVVDNPTVGGTTPPTLRRIDVDSISTALDPEDSRELRVTIGSGGVGSNIRMCDPNISPPSPAACN